MTIIADKGIRFANHLIDNIGIALLLMLHAFVLDGMLHLVPENGSPFLGLYFLLLYFGYHFIFEYYFGKTPGKFITNTMVVDIDNNKPSVKRLLMRNLCRLIPFDAFSFLLGDGWHDSISSTKVINVDSLKSI
jgi:uncharacterized RDD family membrane protein YckC